MLAFTFQSGYIPTILLSIIQFKKNKLYIPIWLYSNATSLEPLFVPTLLYIPIWLYSNYVKAEFNVAVPIFTFQSGYIPTLKNAVTSFGFISPLHSNLVIFQPSHYNTTYLQTLKAAFCRPSFFNPSYRNIFCELFLLSLFRPLLQ